MKKDLKETGVKLNIAGLLLTLLLLYVAVSSLFSWVEISDVTLSATVICLLMIYAFHVFVIHVPKAFHMTAASFNSGVCFFFFARWFMTPELPVSKVTLPEPTISIVILLAHLFCGAFLYLLYHRVTVDWRKEAA